MKYFIAVQFTLIVCFSIYVSGFISYPKFKPALPKVLAKHLHLSNQKFLKECKKTEVLDEVKNQDYLATQMAYALANVIVRRAKKWTKINENHWNLLLNHQCFESAGVTGVIVDNVAQINKCFVEKKQLKGWKKLNFTSALIKAYCAAVKKLAKKTYTAEKKQGKKY